MFAKYLDHVEDSREISGFSRFMSGGIGGITSQLSMHQPIDMAFLMLTSGQAYTRSRP